MLKLLLHGHHFEFFRRVSHCRKSLAHLNHCESFQVQVRRRASGVPWIKSDLLDAKQVAVFFQIGLDLIIVHHLSVSQLHKPFLYPLLQRDPVPLFAQLCSCFGNPKTQKQSPLFALLRRRKQMRCSREIKLCTQVEPREAFATRHRLECIRIGKRRSPAFLKPLHVQPFDFAGRPHVELFRFDRVFF